MNKQEVFQAIESELKYQETLVNNKVSYMLNETFSMGDTLGAIRYNLDKATSAWYYDSISTDYANTTEFLRKIAALAIRIMIKHGVKNRTI